jgi:hypothetical protein
MVAKSDITLKPLQVQILPASQKGNVMNPSIEQIIKMYLMENGYDN